LSDDIENIEAARARLRALREQRIAERIENGEAVLVDLCVVAGSETQAHAQVEEAKAAKLAELHARGDQREVVWAVTLVTTGVRRHGEAADPASVPSAPAFSSGEDSHKPSPFAEPRRTADATLETQDNPESSRRRADDAALETQDNPAEPVVATYVQVQTRACRDDDDPGEISEAWFSVTDGQLTLTTEDGKYIGSCTLPKDADARVVAKRLLREKTPESESFSRRIDYPDMGLA
jgi:hypothetical protein